MFKKFRKNRITTEPPAAPNTEEILADLETFQVAAPIKSQKNNTEDPMDQWWQNFEEYAEGHKNLKVLETEIYTCKEKLSKHKNELEAQILEMKKEIEAEKAQANGLTNLEN